MRFNPSDERLRQLEREALLNRTTLDSIGRIHQEYLRYGLDFRPFVEKLITAISRRKPRVIPQLWVRILGIYNISPQKAYDIQKLMTRKGRNKLIPGFQGFDFKHRESNDILAMKAISDILGKKGVGNFTRRSAEESGEETFAQVVEEEDPIAIYIKQSDGEMFTMATIVYDLRKNIFKIMYLEDIDPDETECEGCKEWFSIRDLDPEGYCLQNCSDDDIDPDEYE